MQDYRPNSHKAKSEEKALVEKKVEKVISGTAKVRKKNGARKVADAFISEDAANVKSYIFNDVVVPTVKDLISDVIKSAVDTILFGGSSSRRNGNRRRNDGYVSYNRFSDRRDDRRDSRASVTSRYSLDDIILDSKGDAEYVLEQMDAILDTYGMVTVADLYDLVDISRDYTDQNYGWTSLGGARVTRVRDGGYMLELPRVTSLK